MGIHDRDYYRPEGSGFFGSFAEQGRVTAWLIGINIACFFLQMMTLNREGSAFTSAFVLDVSKVMHGQVWRLLTYAFLHDTQNIWHIVFNMLFLLWFGRMVEDTIGGREYLWFYLAAAFLGGLGFMAACMAGLHASNSVALGASGAVTAVLVLSACYNPRQVILLFFFIPMPIWGFVILNVALDTFGLLGGGRSGVATSVHLAGAAFGYAYFKLGWRLSGWTGWIRSYRLPRSRPNLRVYKEDPEEVTVPPRTQASSAPAPSPRLIEDEHLEAQVDAILEKIQQVGMGGLSEHERQVLVRASEAIKRRRN